MMQTHAYSAVLRHTASMAQPCDCQLLLAVSIHVTHAVWRDSEQQQGRGHTAHVEGRWFTSEVKWNTKADAGLFLTSSGVPICSMRPLHAD